MFLVYERRKEQKNKKGIPTQCNPKMFPKIGIPK